MADSADIARAVHEGVLRAASGLRPDVLEALRAATAVERSPRAGRVLDQLIENAGIASRDGVPLCQDTGTVWVWVELGDQERLDARLQERIDAAVASAFTEGALRMSVARDGLFDRGNTGDNTPAFVDITVRPGTGARVHVMLKGGGSDNASAVAMLPPAAGMQGVRSFVLEQVATKATGACPPLVVGVAVGSTFDKVGLLAKRALLRPLSAVNPDPKAAAFERELLDAINDLGIGPAGLGGDTTALAVRLTTAPSHIACLPVAVNMGCCAIRSVSMDVA